MVLFKIHEHTSRSPFGTHSPTSGLRLVQSTKAKKAKLVLARTEKDLVLMGGVRIFFFWRRSSSSYWRVAQVLSLEEKMDFPERCKMSNQAQVSSLEFKSAKNLELTWNLAAAPRARYNTQEWDHTGPWNGNIWHENWTFLQKEIRKFSFANII